MWSFSEVRGQKLLITSQILNQSKQGIAHWIDRNIGFRTIYTMTQSQRAFSHYALFSIGTKRSFGYSPPKTAPKAFTIVLKVLCNNFSTHVNRLLT